MEVTNYSLSRLKLLSINLLLLEHLFLIFSSFIFQQLFPLFHHIINILWFFIHSPSVINLRRLEFVLVVIHQCVNLTILFYLNSHFFNLCYYTALKVVFELTALLNILRGTFYFLLNLSELLQLFTSGFYDSLSDNLY